MFFKKILPILLLVGLVAWGVYDYITNSSGTSDNPTEIESQDDRLSVKEQTGDEAVGLEVGNIAPDFTLQTLEGETVKLSDFRGKKVMINFWATWCPPCRAEMPHMQSFYEKQKDDDFAIVAVNMTGTENSRDDVQPFIDELGITFSILMDEDLTVTDTYEVIAYPTSYFVDKDGIIHYKVFGAVNEEFIEKQIAQMNE